MFERLKQWITRPKVDNTPIAEYNFGPFTRVLVRGQAVPQIGTVITFGVAEMTYFGILHIRMLSENDAFTFDQRLRWRVTDVERFLTTSEHDYHYRVRAMEMSPHCRVYLEPVEDTVNLTDTLPARQPETVE